MTKSAKNGDIEDVLSSIRRLVATDRQAVRTEAGAAGSDGDGAVARDAGDAAAAAMTAGSGDPEVQEATGDLLVERARWDADAAEDAGLAAPELPPTFRRSAARPVSDPDLLTLRPGASAGAVVPGATSAIALGAGEAGSRGPFGHEAGQTAEGEAEQEARHRSRHPGGSLPRAGFRFGSVAAPVAAGSVAKADVDDRDIAAQDLAEAGPAEPPEDVLLLQPSAGEPSAAVVSPAGVWTASGPAAAGAGPGHGRATAPNAAATSLNDVDLTALVAATIERELKGSLGRKVTQEIRRLVRQEIALALAAHRQRDDGGQ